MAARSVKSENAIVLVNMILGFRRRFRHGGASRAKHAEFDSIVEFRQTQ
jgi:hypothetical protein